MKIFFLIPPSEGKNHDGMPLEEELSFQFEKPITILQKITETDLKCQGKYFEGMKQLNNSTNGCFCKAIERYSGVMYNAIDYKTMDKKGQDYFCDNFLILSGMYGIVRPDDLIQDYKLPIEAKGLLSFWKGKILPKICAENPDYIVSLLPLSYEKILDIKNTTSLLREKNIHFIRVEFLRNNGKRLGHTVKKVKGQYIREICEHIGDTIIKNPKIYQESENTSILPIMGE